MVKYREILRLFALGVSRRNIAYSCGCAASTVQSVLIRAKAKGVSWPLPDEMTDPEIRRILYPLEDRQAVCQRAEIDHEYIESQLLKRGVTMTLLWNEYCDSSIARGEQPYMLTAFTDRHRRWKRKNTLSMHIDRKPAEQMQVDWVGDTMRVCDPDTGEQLKAYIFVATLPWSGYAYAEAFYRMDIEAWVTAHVHAFNFFDGTTPVLVPDNCKTAVIKHAQNELILNDEYRHMAEYYGIAIVPARVRKPKDKGNVEMTVGLIERQAIAPLRNKLFFNLKNLNTALQEKVAEINAREFQKKPGSRESLYLGQEKSMLTPLPTPPYEYLIRKRVTVNFNYHVNFDEGWYSVPYQYVKREVDIVASKSTVTINCDGMRIANHIRLYVQGSYSTKTEHMPQSHQDFLEWNGDKFRDKAKEIGPNTLQVISSMLESRQVEQQSYQSCRSLLKLGEKHNAELLEEACSKALLYTSRPSYKSVKSVISALSEQLEPDTNEYAYLRGADYYQEIENEISKTHKEN